MKIYMVIIMKVKFLIPTMDDSTEIHSTSFLMRHTIPKHRKAYDRHRINRIGEYRVHVQKPNISSRSSKKLDPMTDAIAGVVAREILPSVPSHRSNRRRYGTVYDNSDWEKYTLFITFKRKNGDSMLWIQKNKNGFSLNSERMSKTDVCTALAKILYKSCFTQDAEVLDDYIDKCTKFPANITYVLENRTPYNFYDFGNKVDVRINTKLISDTHAALEISEGIWGKISIVDLNRFVNTFANNSSRSKKWYRIAPSNLWEALMGEAPTNSQKTLMIEWLKQNRTSKMVEQRARELLYDLEREYDNMLVVSHENYMALFVRGEQADWIIADAERGMKRHHQKVNTYFWAGDEHGWQGPICIDNIHSNSSIGDQLAARGLMLRNDTNAAHMIYTLRGTPPIKEQWNGKYRFDMTKLVRWADRKTIAPFDHRSLSK